MPRTRPTVADIRAIKGTRQLTMLRILSLEEAEAAEAANVDIASVSPELILDPRFREAAPGLFAMPGLNFFDLGTTDEAVRWAFKMFKAGADCVYCSGSFATVRRLADEHIPVVGHIGLVPSRNTWTGGFKAVGKTAAGAIKLMQEVKAYEEAGAFGVEVEVIPVEVAEIIAANTDLLLLGMGAGTAAHAQYLFAEDVLGTNRGHVPRHSKVYRNFAAEFDRLQGERVAAFKEFVNDVETGVYPENRHNVYMDPAELEAFKAAIKNL